MSIKQYLEGDDSAKSLPESLYNDLRTDILSGQYIKGSRLTEQSICERYKVSRTPVREALSRLQSEGLVVLEKNRGALISGFTSADLDDLLELKQTAEMVAIRRAISSITKQDMQDVYFFGSLWRIGKDNGTYRILTPDLQDADDVDYNIWAGTGEMQYYDVADEECWH